MSVSLTAIQIRNVSAVGNAPGGRDSWQSSDRGLGSQGGMDHSMNRTQERWPPAMGSAPTDRSIRPQTTGLVMNTPLIQNPPASQTFLASAANIMMGVGLAGGNRPQENRYDAYKNLSGGNIRRY